MSRAVLGLSLLVLLLVALGLFRFLWPKAGVAEPSYRLVFFRHAPGEPGRLGVFTIAPEGGEERLLISKERVYGEMVSTNSVAFSPNGQWFVYLTAPLPGPSWKPVSNTLRLSRPGDARSKVIARADDFSYLPPYPVWSPDGTRVAFVRAGAMDRWEEFGASELWLINPFDGRRRLVAKDPRIRLYHPSVIWWFGERLFWYSRDGLYGVDLGTGQVFTIVEGLPFLYAAAICCQGGKLVVASQYAPPRASEFIARAREIGWELVEVPYGARWDIGGHIVVYRVGRQIWMTDLELGESRMLLEKPVGSEAASPVGISPDRRWVVFWTYEGLETVEILTDRHWLAVPGDHRSGPQPDKGPTAEFIGWALNPLHR